MASDKRIAEFAGKSLDDKLSTILLVEDDPVSAGFFVMVLSASCRVEKVGTKREGLSRLMQRSHRPVNLLMLDLQLPNGSGPELAAEFKLAAPEVPMVIVTGGDYDIAKYDIFSAGASAWLRKPVSVEQLLDTVAKEIAKAKVIARWVNVEEMKDKVKELVTSSGVKLTAEAKRFQELAAERRAGVVQDVQPLVEKIEAIQDQAEVLTADIADAKALAEDEAKKETPAVHPPEDKYP